MKATEKSLTLQAYQQNATALAEYFRGIGSRVEDIERGFALTGLANPKVVEIGCGDGRDAREILGRTGSYLGIDVSSAMIELAQALSPDGNFVVADAAEFDFPQDTDIIFAFAALLHSDREEVKSVLQSAHTALSKKGILYISLTMDYYHKFLKEDQFGRRWFYAYEPKDIQKIANGLYETVYLDTQSIGNTDWFTITLQKREG